MWTAQLNRLPTRMRLAAWGLNFQTSYYLCFAFDETREHFLFWCGFSVEIWTAVQQRIGVSPFLFQSWSALLAWVKIRSNSAPRLLRKLVAHTILYYIWMERNNRLFNFVSKTSSQLFRDIEYWQTNSQYNHSKVASDAFWKLNVSMARMSVRSSSTQKFL